MRRSVPQTQPVAFHNESEVTNSATEAGAKSLLYLAYLRIVSHIPSHIIYLLAPSVTPKINTSLVVAAAEVEIHFLQVLSRCVVHQANWIGLTLTRNCCRACNSKESCSVFLRYLLSRTISTNVRIGNTCNLLGGRCEIRALKTFGDIEFWERRV